MLVALKLIVILIISLNRRSLNRGQTYLLYRGYCHIEDRYIGVPLYEVFRKGKVDLNSVKFETRSIV